MSWIKYLQYSNDGCSQALDDIMLRRKKEKISLQHMTPTKSKPILVIAVFPITFPFQISFSDQVAATGSTWRIADLFINIVLILFTGWNQCSWKRKSFTKGNVLLYFSVVPSYQEVWYTMHRQPVIQYDQLKALTCNREFYRWQYNVLINHISAACVLRFFHVRRDNDGTWGCEAVNVERPIGQARARGTCGIVDHVLWSRRTNWNAL